MAGGYGPGVAGHHEVGVEVRLEGEVVRHCGWSIISIYFKLRGGDIY